MNRYVRMKVVETGNVLFKWCIFATIYDIRTYGVYAHVGIQNLQFDTFSERPNWE